MRPGWRVDVDFVCPLYLYLARSIDTRSLVETDGKDLIKQSARSSNCYWTPLIVARDRRGRPMFGVDLMNRSEELLRRRSLCTCHLVGNPFRSLAFGTAPMTDCLKSSTLGNIDAAFPW